MIRLKLIPYEVVKNDFSKVLKALQGDVLVLIDAKLDPKEEADLIKNTMERLNERFKGIELSSMEFTEKSGLKKIRGALAEALSGKKRGFTIIGPATMVRKIKKNPSELLVYM